MYTHEQLQDFIDGKIIGESYPYNTKNEEEIEAYIKHLYYRIQRIPNIICEAEFDHYGSGYASFVEFFCYRKEDIVVIKDQEQYGILAYEKTGVLLNVSRLAPVFIYGEGERSQTVRAETNEEITGASCDLPGQTNIFSVHEKFDGLTYQLFKALKEFGYESLDEKYANEPLPFQANIPTFYRRKNEYRKLDAIFYWED